MARDRGVRPCVGLWILLSLTMLATACRKKEPATAENPPAAEPSVQPAPPATSRIAPTDDDLTTYVEWYRDWKLLTNRYRAELDAVTEQAAVKYSLEDTGKIAQDPDLLAFLDRQRREMQPHMDRAPRGATAEAFKATLAGLGQMVFLPGGMVYVAGRNEPLLAEARRKYGDAFVDWVLARESTIVGTLGQ